MPESTSFPGFSDPNFTRVPDEIFDALLPNLSKAELKVLLYIVRRTFGSGKIADAISVSQIADGISTLDGRLLDRGTGLSRASIHTATRSLVEYGVLIVKQGRDEAGDFTANHYSLRFAAGENAELGHFLTDVSPETIAPTRVSKSSRLKKQKISHQLRRQVFERDSYRCRTCNTHLELSVDHIVPESKGGSLDLNNLQTLCSSCNRRKGVRV